MPDVLALVPARNEAPRVGSTVRELRSVVDEVVLIDDGSRDRTAHIAAASGARVIRAPYPAGKGAALEAGLRRCGSADVFLFADADLEESVAGLRVLVEAVVSGRVDMAIADVPAPSSEGFGLVRRAAGAMIERACGAKMEEPLSGQRALTAECLTACRPLAAGFGVEVGLTTDAVRMGFSVVEIPVELRHRSTGRDIPGFVHRGRQGIDALRAFIPRALAFR